MLCVQRRKERNLHHEMAFMVVAFHGCVQDSQEYGSDREHMVSRVFFDLVLDEIPQGPFFADIKQTVGSDFESGGMEVGPPTGEDGAPYSGPFSHASFAGAAEEYFRGLVGSSGSGIHVSGASSNIRMSNNAFRQEGKASFDVPDKLDAW